MTSSPLLEMRGIGKRFPGVIALDNVSLAVGKGDVVALCGENGAGKSTLMKILGGVYQPDVGEILVDGRPVKINNVNDAMRLGIAFIHQELNVLDNLDVAANVFLGREPLLGPFGLIDRKKIHADTEPLLRRLGLDISSRTRLGELSIAQQQMVEIAKALSVQARLIIMDEPTSSLTLTETERLLELICELSDQDVSVIYISHRLSEITNCADRVVVLRDGRNAGVLEQKEVSHDKLVGMMVGREIKNFYVAAEATPKPRRLRVRNARSGAYPEQRVSFDASGGEILGFAGLVGAGRSELVQAIVGLDRAGSAEVWLDDRKLDLQTPRRAIEQGFYLVPEDRRVQGLVVQMAVRENITLPSLRRYSPGGLIRRDRENRVSEQQVSSLGVKTPGIESLVRNLSGGNQQKVMLGKWLAMDPQVMILDEPTRGIDVGAKSEIYKLMRALAGQGGVILMISSDMEGILHVSDRIALLHPGRI